jgi:hypothetical protein
MLLRDPSCIAPRNVSCRLRLRVRRCVAKHSAAEPVVCDHRSVDSVDSLKLFSDDRPRFSILRVRYRISHDRERSPEPRGEHLPAGVQVIDGEQLPRHLELVVSIWRQMPDKARVKYSGGHDDGAVWVRAGERWRQTRPHAGTSAGTNGDGASSLGDGLDDLLDSSSLPSVARLEAAGRRTRAGRKVITVHASPHSLAAGTQPKALLRFGAHADYYSLELDAEYGIPLAAVAYANDVAFQRLQALEVEINAPIDPSLFALPPHTDA